MTELTKTFQKTANDLKRFQPFEKKDGKIGVSPAFAQMANNYKNQIKGFFQPPNSQNPLVGKLTQNDPQAKNEAGLLIGMGGGISGMLGRQFLAIEKKLHELTLNGITTFLQTTLTLALEGIPAEEVAKAKEAFSEMQNTMAKQFAPVMTGAFERLNTNLPRFQQAMEGIGSVLSGILFLFFSVVDGIAGVVSIVRENWDLIGSYLIAGIMTLVAYFTLLKIEAIKDALEVAGKWLTAGWPILLIIALVGTLIFLLQRAGLSFGEMAGAIGATLAVVGALVANVFLGLLELIFGVVEYIYNIFASIGNFVVNAADDFGGSVARLIFGFVDAALQAVETLAKALDFVFGQNWAGGVAKFRTDVQTFGEQVYERLSNGKEYNEKFKKLDMDHVLAEMGIQLARFEYGKAFESGFQFGENFADSFSGMGDLLAGIGGSTAQTAQNTGAMAGQIELGEESLSALRALADRGNINRFTTAEIRVDVGGVTQNMASYADGAHALDHLIGCLCEACDQLTAEGVYS